MADQDDDYFNDLSQRPMLPRSGNTGGNNSGNEDDGNPIPRQKRMACVVCRKRKLRCDGKKPSCGTCARVGHNCAYDEVRKKSGPKRGYVKQLEARLAQVETLLRNQEPENSSNATNHNTIPNATVPSTTSDAIPDLFNFSNQSIPQRSDISGQSASSQKATSTANSTVDTEKSWEVISLGLEEALPSQEVMDELFDVYFKKIHPSSPMIHRARFFAAMDLAPHMRPPVCLRYIMWALAAALTPKYSFLEEHLYARARKYIHMDEMKGHGEHMVSMHHCQAWILIALYEFKQMYFPRAWISVGRAARMAVMMCFNRLDGVGLDVKHCVPPPRDWVDKEERRRTFWMCFAEDRFASIGTGWPMTFDERDIMTNLPSSEEAFLTGKAETAPSLKDVLAGDIANLSPLGIVSVMACVFGLNLTHLHRPDSQDREGDINGEFWKRHRAYDNILLNVALSLPQSLRLPQGISNPNIIFANMSIHTSAICLHQAAIFKAEKYKKLSQIAAESKRRCIIAADQVTSIMRMVSHTDLSLLNPFSAFCLYVAARVFVQYLKSRPDDEAVQSSLQFLLTALGALKQFSALTESFMIQLDVDLSGTSFGSTMASMRSKQAAQSMNDAGCTPLVHIGSSQTDLHTNESLHKDAPASHRSSSASGGGSVSLQNMPNRPRQNNPPRTNQQQPLGRERLHGSSGNSTDVTRNNSPGQDDQNRLMNYDMDISSDNMNSASDNPSPETLNSSSNTAFTPPNMDQLSVNGQSYNASKNMANSNFMDFGADINGLSNQNDMSFSPLFDMSASNVPIDTLGVENPMALNTIWSDHIAQPAGLENSSFSMEGTNNLSDPQFDMLLRGMGWNGWDDQAIGQ